MIFFFSRLQQYKENRTSGSDGKNLIHVHSSGKYSSYLGTLCFIIIDFAIFIVFR